MTLKKLFLAAMASVLVSTGMQAQVENFEIFRHVGGNLNVGTEGIGFDVATPVTDLPGGECGNELHARFQS